MKNSYISIMDIEQVLFVARDVDVYRIPPRTGRGHISGEWLRDNKLASQRCKVVCIGSKLEVRLDDPVTGEIFGVCPVVCGQREASVESAVDSSRNFVLRLVDPETGRHAFVGLSFAERSVAFDFNVSLTEFERKQRRKEELDKGLSIPKSTDDSGKAGSSTNVPQGEAAILYNHEDLKLKDGESIKISINAKKETKSGGFLSRLGAGETSIASKPLLGMPGSKSQSLGETSTKVEKIFGDAEGSMPLNFNLNNTESGDGKSSVKDGPLNVALQRSDWATF